MGIGETIARSLAAAGAKLAIISRSEDKLASLTKELRSSNNIDVIYKTLDVGDHKAVDEAVASVVKELGEIDVLINNVGSPIISLGFRMTSKIDHSS